MVDNSKIEQKYRTIRSYVIRGVRMTDAQQNAFSIHWPRWGLSADEGLIDFDSAFVRAAPRTLEIGFGMGGSLAEMAAKQADRDFIGIEVHKPGVGKLMHTMAERDIDNIRIFCHDAVEVLDRCIEDSSLDRVQIFFPDPWHKNKHRKRRLIQSEFVEQLRQKVRPGGCLHLATDWQNYAEQMLQVLNLAPGYRNMSENRSYISRPDDRPLTKFELRGERLGHGVWDLMFERID
jgi:tRNA (guanine-N7-)-methyltransferase